MRPTGVFKTENEYQKLISKELYEKTPKAVFAAIAISYFYNSGCKNLDEAIKNEWKLLHDQEIVPQKPVKL